MNKLSVVILNYNGKKYLEKFLPGVVSHSQPYELVLADNGSTDGSVSFVREQLPGVRLLIFEENHGFCGGYNKAIEQIESEYIILLNSDVEVAKGWIAPVLNMMERRPEMAAAQPIEEKVRAEYKADQNRKHDQKINRTHALAMTRDILVGLFARGDHANALNAFDQIVSKTREIIRPNRKNPRKHRLKIPYAMNHRPL